MRLSFSFRSTREAAKGASAPGGTVNTYDPNLHEQQRKLDAIEARLAGHEKTARLSLLWLSTLGFVVLALLGYVIARL
jgi:D-serine deaminase-like pyridoxal phosphate-dependent protein